MLLQRAAEDKDLVVRNAVSRALRESASVTVSRAADPRRPQRRGAAPAGRPRRCCSRSTPRSGASSCIRSRTRRCRRRSTTSTRPPSALLAIESDLEVRLAGDFIFVNATRLRLELDNYASFSHILAILRAFESGRCGSAPADRREWQIFLSLLLSIAERRQPEERFEELQERIGRRAGPRLEIERATPTDERPASTEQAKEAAKRAYSQGVAVTKDVITSVRMGRATSVKRVKRAVQVIVDQVLNNETSLVGLTTMRDYDEYTFTHSVNVCIFSVALGKKLGLVPAPALRPRHGGAAPRHRQGPRAGRDPEQDRPVWTSRSGASCRRTRGSAC